jgi:hypothetical protein
MEGNIVHSYKTTIDKYVNNAGQSYTYTAYYNGSGLNYFNGNIAIGTYDNKGYRLAVNGSAIFTKVKVMPYPWPDYVFNSSYRLRPLSEVEQYIQEHHHLPEVPSAEEVKKDGIDVGDNQAVLLKKIEELTLYVIEQNKKLENQHKAQNEQNQKLQELSQQVYELQIENAQLKKQLENRK